MFSSISNKNYDFSLSTFSYNFGLGPKNFSHGKRLKVESLSTLSFTDFHF